LRIPEGHERTEIGRLVVDINDLTGDLVNTLDQERELRRQQEIAKRMYQDLFDHASSGIFVATTDGSLASFNPAFAELTWLPRDAAQPSRTLLEAGWDDCPHLLDLLRRSASQAISCADDFLLCGRRGDERWLHVACMPLGDGSVQGTLTDVTARKREEMSARRLAITDSLTGFANREGLLQNFATFEDVHAVPFAVVMVNLDGFKQVNDAMGFPVGDQILLKVAERIREVRRAGDFLARIGGDEFVLVLAGMDERHAVEPRIQDLHARLSEPYRLDHGPLSIGASIGIAFAPQDGGDMAQLLRGAELALNSARESTPGTGTRPYAFFHPKLQTAVEHRRRLEDDLRLAVGSGGLRLFFQPIIDLRANRLAGAEALLRWKHPERGFVSPDVFIPLAERVGLIGEIGRQVLDDACRQVAAWRRDGLDMYVSVNVSAKQIPDQLSPAVVLDTLRRHSLPAAAIALEITEGVLMSDVGVAQSWIGQMRAMGLRIFLDDFGTGYSSLSYLKRFPMDTVKIDKSFIIDMNADNSDRALVGAIISMAGSLGLQVVAEGIEQASQLALLRELGCGHGQGYFFSRPVAAADFVATAARIDSELSASRPAALPGQ
jgi:diguanylate cyclase (GGDEF)-like protein